MKGDREQMENLEAAAIADSMTPSRCFSGQDAKTCTELYHRDVNCCVTSNFVPSNSTVVKHP